MAIQETLKKIHWDAEDALGARYDRQIAEMMLSNLAKSIPNVIKQILLATKTLWNTLSHVKTI